MYLATESVIVLFLPSKSFDRGIEPYIMINLSLKCEYKGHFNIKCSSFSISFRHSGHIFSIGLSLNLCRLLFIGFGRTPSQACVNVTRNNIRPNSQSNCIIQTFVVRTYTIYIFLSHSHSLTILEDAYLLSAV